MEQHNIKVLLDAPWNLKTWSGVEFFIFFYKPLKVPLFFLLYGSTN